MSSTILHRITISGEVVDFREYRNSHQYAPPLWGRMGVRYLGWEEGERYWIMGDEKQSQRLWNLVQRKDIPQDHRIALACTYDHIIIPLRNLTRVSAALAGIATGFYYRAEDDHLKTRAQEIAVGLLDLCKEPDAWGACFTMTTVSSFWDSVHIGDEDSDDYEPYNVFLDQDGRNPYRMFSDEGIFYADVEEMAVTP